MLEIKPCYAFGSGGGHKQETRLLPTDTGCEAAIGVDVEENVVETLFGQPVAQSDRSGIVRARMADEQSRHNTISLKGRALALSKTNPNRLNAGMASRCDYSSPVLNGAEDRS